MSLRDEIRRTKKGIPLEDFTEHRKKPDWERNQLLAGAARDEELKVMHLKLAEAQKRELDEKQPAAEVENREYIRLAALEEGPTAWQKMLWRLAPLASMPGKAWSWAKEHSRGIFIASWLGGLATVVIQSMFYGLAMNLVLSLAFVILANTVAYSVLELHKRKAPIKNLVFASIILPFFFLNLTWKTPMNLTPQDLGVVTNNGEFKRFICKRNNADHKFHEPPSIFAGDKLEWFKIVNKSHWNIELRPLITNPEMPETYREQAFNFFMERKLAEYPNQFSPDEIMFVFNALPASCQEKMMSLIRNNESLRMTATEALQGIHNQEYTTKIAEARLADADLGNYEALQIMHYAPEELALQALANVFAQDPSIAELDAFVELVIRAGSTKLGALMLERILERNRIPVMFRLATLDWDKALRVFEELQKPGLNQAMYLEIACQALQENVVLAAWNSGKFTKSEELVSIIYEARSPQVKRLAWKEFLRCLGTGSLTGTLITTDLIHSDRVNISEETLVILKAAIEHQSLTIADLIVIIRRSKNEKLKEYAEEVLLKRVK